MSNIAVATTSQLAADAADEVAAAGGNAVDCALAASLMTMNTEPGVCALAGSAFVTVWKDGGDPVSIDGNVAVPGLGLSVEERGHGTFPVSMEYGGGIRTLVGPGSVSVPGSLAALELAWKRFGAANWATLFAPTVRATRNGFPLSAACHYYLGYSGRSVFGRSTDGFAALHEADGTLKAAGSNIIVPGLSDSLDSIARDGARVFYEGELAALIADHCRDGHGALSREDLAAYRAVERVPLLAAVGDWQLATNPPPAIGGAVLTAMLLACSDLPGPNWDTPSLERLVRTQLACLDFRQRRLDLAADVDKEATELIDSARDGRLLSRWASASTVHTSVVDDLGNGCAVTASSGYGSGEMPNGTGIWLNNCLGELELNRRGLNAGPVGSRLPSNMAPSVARNRDAVLAVGSPGADRITTALQQFLINYLSFGMPLKDAIAHPRIHVDTSGEDVRLMAEPGLPLPETGLPLIQYDELSMYFGGVVAAIHDRHNGLSAAADPRREGGTCIRAH